MTPTLPLRVPVTPGPDGLAVVRHGLGLENLDVRAETATGEARGHAYYVEIDPDEFEIALSPDTAVLVIDQAPAAPEGGD